MRIMDMSEEQQKEYFEKEDGGFPVYLSDLLDGKIHLAEVPQKYRTTRAYIYAVRSVRGANEKLVFTEKKLLENLILSDIMEAYRQHRLVYAENLSSIHYSYFYNDRMWC